MRKFLLAILLVASMILVCEGAWDNTTDFQTFAPAAAIQQIQDNFTASGGIAGGILMPSGSVFFMLSGSCPTGTTDITATYTGKFIKINATQGTSSGVVLTGTVDSHTLTTAEIPAHTHPITTALSSGTGSGIVTSSVTSGYSSTSGSAGSGGGHTHTLSSATTLEPSSVTMTLCQVD